MSLLLRWNHSRCRLEHSRISLCVWQQPSLYSVTWYRRPHSVQDLSNGISKNHVLNSHWEPWHCFYENIWGGEKYECNEDKYGNDYLDIFELAWLSVCLCTGHMHDEESWGFSIMLGARPQQYSSLQNPKTEGMANRKEEEKAASTWGEFHLSSSVRTWMHPTAAVLTFFITYPLSSWLQVTPPPLHTHTRPLCLLCIWVYVFRWDRLCR